MVYLAVLFAAAFLLLLLSYFMQQRINRETLDECPMAYKTMEDIVQNIDATAEIQEIIRPIYNFKASGDE